MFLSVNEQVTWRFTPCIVTLSGNDASVVLAECIADEQAFAGQMNALAQRLGLKTTIRIRTAGRTKA